MNNYIIAKPNQNMNDSWIYALSPEGRNAYMMGNKEVQVEILTSLLENGNITMPKLMALATIQRFNWLHKV
tara:strand:+ start:1367 stop:1579 length:213 start_codon:yes stop_codon:yes gene_type:complete